MSSVRLSLFLQRRYQSWCVPGSPQQGPPAAVLAQGALLEADRNGGRTLVAVATALDQRGVVVCDTVSAKGGSVRA